MFPDPPLIEAVEKATAVTNLQAVAARTQDPDVWLGLSFLAQPGAAIRRDLSDKAVAARPEYAPVASVLANAMDGVTEASARDLIQRDPDNALGYYLLADEVFAPGREKESLDAFRKGATCPELRLYGTTISNVLFKALDTLDLKGRDRLCASSWMHTRWANFEIISLQHQGETLQKLGRDIDVASKREISDLMLALAGHLIGADFQTRVFGERTLLGAFHIKADIAATEKSPTMNGYAGVVQALVSTQLSWPGFKRQNPLELAQFVPGRIWRAFVVINPELAKSHLIEMKSKLSDADRPAFEQAYTNAVRAARELIDAALPDQDAIIGAYFKGRMPPRTNAPAPWSTSMTYVERLMVKKPELFKAAAANEDAMHELAEAGDADPAKRNLNQMMYLAQGIFSYASDHTNQFPDSIETLFQSHYLKPPLENKSLITGKPYVFVMAGQKWPQGKFDQPGEAVLLYDENKKGECGCVMADGHGQRIPWTELKDRLAKAPK